MNGTLTDAQEVKVATRQLTSLDEDLHRCGRVVDCVARECLLSVRWFASGSVRVCRGGAQVLECEEGEH
jgi:hypothetical protein